MSEKKNEFPRDTFSLLAIKAFRKSLFFFSAGTTWQKLTLIRLDILKVAFFGGRGGGEGGGGEGGDCPLRISRRTNPILTKLYTIINNFKSLQWKNKFIYVLPMSLFYTPWKNWFFRGIKLYISQKWVTMILDSSNPFLTNVPI